MIVVDANVAAKWYLPEPGSDAALITADRPFHDRAKASYKQISLLPGCEDN